MNTYSSPSRQLLKFEEVGIRLSVTPKHVRKMTYTGILPVVKLGRRCVRVPLEAVEQFIASRTITAQERAAVSLPSRRRKAEATAGQVIETPATPERKAEIVVIKEGRH